MKQGEHDQPHGSTFTEGALCVSCTHGFNRRKHFPNVMKIENPLNQEARSTGHKLHSEELFPKKGSTCAQIWGVALCPWYLAWYECLFTLSLWTQGQSMRTM